MTSCVSSSVQPPAVFLSGVDEERKQKVKVKGSTKKERPPCLLSSLSLLSHWSILPSEKGKSGLFRHQPDFLLGDFFSTNQRFCNRVLANQPFLLFSKFFFFNQKVRLHSCHLPCFIPYFIPCFIPFSPPSSHFSLFFPFFFFFFF